MASDISTLDIKEIVRLLPHRYPFLLLDRVTALADDGNVALLEHVPRCDHQ